ncbi:hypothetical protein [Komagataeibacter oboediens]|uniref:hypothetical protein n=1 Tax=Komagataeibacter oboediens TaxID=65958 RepID=UPI000237E3C4|nr:hypothetical protein [Komagataeibacter oboediens]
MNKNTPEPRRFIIGLDRNGEVIDCRPKDGKFCPCPLGYAPQTILVVTADVDLPA